MAILTVGPTSNYPTIAAAMANAIAGDTIQLESGYSNETATITLDGMIVTGDATSIGIVLQLGNGIPTLFLAGTAPIDVQDAVDGNGMVGNDGDNVITVTGGADSVSGGLGDDRLVVDYHLTTGAITGTTASVADAGGLGTTTITGGFEHFTILTGSGADTITTGAGDDIISTGEGASTVTAGHGANQVTGGSGVDTITAGDGGNLIDGGAGNDGITTGAGNDVVIAGLGNDTVVTGGGDDVTTVNGGSDTVDSGIGSDRLVIDFSSSNTSVNGSVTGGTLAGGYDGFFGDFAGTSSVMFQGTENFTITTGNGHDTIGTGDGDDVLDGGAGFDSLSSGGGADTLLSGLGNDDLDGGAGTDTVLFSGTRADYQVTDIGGGVIQIIDLRTGSPDGTDTIVNMEGFVFTDGTFNGTTVLVPPPVTFTVGPNSTYPSIAAAMIVAGPNDIVQLEAGYGNETATVTHSGMTIIGDVSSTGIVLQLGTGIALVTLTGAAPITILDASDDNGIVGNAGNNLITVTGGVDAVDAGLGVDRLTVDYRLATGDVTGDSTSNFTEAGGGGRSVTIADGTIEHFTVLTGAGADTITTGMGDDIINTGDGASTVSSGQGANTITGGANDDTITALDGGNYIDGGDGTNTLTSGGGTDTIFSGTGADTIVAGGGDDNITVRGGADSVNGGAANDRLFIDYSALTTNVTGGVTGGTLSSGYVGYLADLAASSVDFVGTENFTITSGSGNDVITTGGGIDVLKGGSGKDTLEGGSGVDTLEGGADNDTYVLADEAAGIDTVTDISGIDTITSTISRNLGFADYSEIENLTLLGGLANMVATGNAAANRLDGSFSAVANTLRGLAGNDHYFVGVGDAVDETSAGSSGIDSVFATFSYTLGTNLENLYLQGAAAGVNGTGNALGNQLVGSTQSGANILRGLAGNDIYTIGVGDTADETFAGSSGHDTVRAAFSFTLGTNLEGLALIGTTAGMIGTGNGLANVMDGTQSTVASTFRGLAGNDTYILAAGDIADETTPGSSGVDYVRINASYTLGANLENLSFYGTATGMIGIGNGLSNVLDGTQSAVANTLRGLAGNDLYIVGTGDIVDETSPGSAGTDTVRVGFSYTLGTNLENISVFGGAAGIVATGNAANNLLLGTQSGFANTLRGLAGNDSYILGAGDVADETAPGSAGTDLVLSAVSQVLGTGLENLTLQGTAAINGTGNGLANLLQGNAAKNTLKGGANNDTLRGDLGQDSLFGEAGNDTFRFLTTADSLVGAARDIIFDLDDAGDDRIDLSLMAGVTEFIGANAFTAAGQVRAIQAGANVLVQINTVGNTVAESEILIAGATLGNGVGQVGANDFLL